MTSALRGWLCDPLFLLCLTAGLLAFVVQSGELGTADTSHRLQTTHWLWTSEPQVFPYEYPEFGLHGRGGHLYSWYGIGQSLLMLPFDLVGTWVSRWPAFAGTRTIPRSAASSSATASTSWSTFSPPWLAFRFLGRFDLALKESASGVLALLFCTTHLHYTQNMMENNYIMLLTLTGFCYQYQWLRTDSRRALFVGSCAFGLNLLTRLTTGLDLIAGGLFVLLTLCFDRAQTEKQGNQGLWRRLIAYCKIAAPVYLFFLVVDRLYQFYRFGSLTNTYVSIFAREQRQMDPTLPQNFPWSTPFHSGVLGPLFQPEKSIFLFDPLLVLAIFLVPFLWKRLSPEVRAYGLTSFFLLGMYICFYAKYTYWAGDFAWGDRYVSTSVELVALLAVPLLMRYRDVLGRNIYRAGWLVVLVSLMIQAASLAFWLPLEIYQMETLGHPTYVIGLRFKNILAFALGKMDAWGLANESMTQDPWDYVHITTWNFLPFLLRRVGVASTRAVDSAFAIWLLATAALGSALFQLRRIVDSPSR